ncbi:universal stress protein [Agromyces sp. SYSU T0242]|uniref:universal stress protein n=1 Tax=Agromyces litoreus TaxID=3158561 RepID=UPI003395A056
MTIVVGADGSVASRAAVDWAARRADRTGEDLALVTIVDDGWGSVGNSVLAELRAAAEDLAARELDAARAVAPGAVVGSSVVVGSPILTLAEASRGAGLVVVGTHKVGYFHGRAMGSRSLQLAAVAASPTAVVPVTSWRGRSGVAVGVSDGHDSDDAVRFAAEEASRLGEPLVLLRAVDGDGIDDRALDRAGDIAADAAPEVPVERRTAAGAASDSLIGISRRAVLTVTGRRVASRGFLPLGRTNSDVLMNLAGPVVVSPQVVVEAYLVGWSVA